MNANTIARHYKDFTPEERFRLILAASGRGDEAEADRLANAAQWIKLRTRDFAPYGNAFNDLHLLTFIQLLEEAAAYLEIYQCAFDTSNRMGVADDEGEEGDEAEGSNDTEAEHAEGEPAEANFAEEPFAERNLDLVLFAGYLLRAKAEGWKRFCERLNVPPFFCWEDLPGFERLQRALALAERVAFTPEGVLRWLNRVRPAGTPERTEVPPVLTVEGIASTNEYAYRKHAERWGG
jgi:hypothetical protein